MLNINIDCHTNTDELDLIGNFLKELSKLRYKKELKLVESNTTAAPKKTKAQPVTLTALEPSGALPESVPVAEGETSAPAPEVLEAKKPEPVQEPEPEVVAQVSTEADAPEVTEPDPVLDLVALRAAIAPIMKDKKDALVALVKEYGESLPKIDPIHYPEILAKAKEL